MFNPHREILERVLNYEIDFEKVGRDLAMLHPDLFLEVLDHGDQSIVKIHDDVIGRDFKFYKSSIKEVLARPTFIDAIKSLRTASNELNDDRISLKAAKTFMDAHYNKSENEMG